MSISLLWFWACSSWSILADFLCIGCNLHEFKIPHKKINLLHLLKRSLVCGGNAAYALSVWELVISRQSCLNYGFLSIVRLLGLGCDV